MNLPSLIPSATPNYRKDPVPTGAQAVSSNITHHTVKPDSFKPRYSYKPRFSGGHSVMDAVRMNNAEALRKALESKADIKEKYQEPYLLDAFFGKEKTNEMNALHVLAHQPDPKPECIRLLLKHGLDINEKEKGTDWTALHRHMYNWRPSADATRTLLENNIDVNATDENGETALHILANRAWTEPKLPVVKLLHAYGADMNPVSDLGRTPLQLMAKRFDPNLEVAQYLIRTGHTESDRASLKKEFLENYQKHNAYHRDKTGKIKQTLQKIKAFSTEGLSDSERPDFKKKAFITKFHPPVEPTADKADAAAPISKKPAVPEKSATPEKPANQDTVKEQGKTPTTWHAFVDSIKALISAFLDLFRGKKQET